MIIIFLRKLEMEAIYRLALFAHTTNLFSRFFNSFLAFPNIQ